MRSVFQIKLPHVAKILSGKSMRPGKGFTQITRQLFHNGFAPSEFLLLLDDVLADRPVEADHFVIHGTRGLNACGLDAGFYCCEKRNVFGIF